MESIEFYKSRLVEDATDDLKIGDRVLCIKNLGGALTNGMIGTVCELRRNSHYGVEFDSPFSCGHSCGGLCSSGCGRRFYLGGGYCVHINDQIVISSSVEDLL